MNLMKVFEGIEIIFDREDVFLETILSNNKYLLLLKYLNEKKIFTTNDIKKLSVSDYNLLKMSIPNLSGVGEYKINSYLGKLDEIRRKQFYNKQLLNSPKKSDFVVENNCQNIGTLSINNNVDIEINYLIFNDMNEYIDIRQIRKDGTIEKKISIKTEKFEEFKKIINKIIIPDPVQSLVLNNLNNVDLFTTTQKMIKENEEKRNKS